MWQKLRKNVPSIKLLYGDVASELLKCDFLIMLDANGEYILRFMHTFLIIHFLKMRITYLFQNLKKFCQFIILDLNNLKYGKCYFAQFH